MRLSAAASGGSAPCGRSGITRRLLLGLLALAPIAAAAEERGPRPRLAMWVWKDRVLAPDGMAAFADRHRIETLLVYVSPTAAEALLAGERSAQASVEEMRRNGRRVYAVAGEPEWARGPADLPQHADLLVRLIKDTKHFDGLHFDVEPNALEDWSDPLERQTLIASTLRFYDLLRSAAASAQIDAAVNPAFADLATATGENFVGALARRLDSLSIMAYRNSVPRTLAWAQAAVKQAIARERLWRIGVLVDDNPTEPGTSWKGVPRELFSSAMQDLDRSLVARYRSTRYAGLVFQDYDGLIQLYGS